MSEDAKRDESRRELLRSAVRWLAAGGLVLAGGRLVLRRRAPDGQSHCVRGGACQGCRVLRECGLPSAESARRAMTKG